MHRFLRAKAECFARLCHRLGICPFVTLVICIKTVQARITKSSLWAAPRSLVYRDKISCHWVQGFPSNEGVKKRYPLKRRHFAVIGSNNVKTVADRYIHAAYHNKHWWQAFWIHEHRWPWTPWTPQREVFSEFFSQFLDAAHISTPNCDEMAGDRPRQPAHEIFSIQCRFQQFKSRPPRFKEAGAGRRQRQLTPLNPCCRYSQTSCLS